MTARTEGYLFIDNVRFISMLAIVMRHCELWLFGGSPTPLLEREIIQLRTFGVPLFFISSAFLMAAWLTRPAASVQAYWKSRVHQVALPWLLWVGVFQVLELTKLWFRHGLDLNRIIEQSWQNVFYQSYWFVPILLLSLAMLLPVRRYWHAWWLGTVLLVLSLLYGVNLYCRWFPASHTVAWFGFLFPFWLGIQIFERFQSLEGWVDRLPWGLILAGLCLGVSLMHLEERALLIWGIPNRYNALQLSNQLYALIVLVVFMKLSVRLMPAWIDVRKDTYGIYLTHQIVSSLALGVIALAARLSRTQPSLFQRLPELIHSPYSRIGLIFMWFLLVYTISLLITKALRMTQFAWIVGAKEEARCEALSP
jgi:peptidoglycan/LPS O-acetylase OafA/YrhL